MRTILKMMAACFTIAGSCLAAAHAAPMDRVRLESRAPGARSSSGGGLTLNWRTIAGGGGISTDGVLTLTGTIGQPVVDEASGGGLTLFGGFWPGLGGFRDCNGNKISDSQDIANCDSMDPDYPACADCNSNGVPDGCDLVSGAAGDCNMTGVPDSCEQSGVIPSLWITDAGLWNTAANWCPGIVPDNGGGNTFQVSIPDNSEVGPATVVTLNISPGVNSFSLADGAVLEVNAQSGNPSRSLSVADPDGFINAGILRAKDAKRLLLDVQDAISLLQESTGVLEAIGMTGQASKIQILGQTVTGGTARTQGDSAIIELLNGVLIDVIVAGNVVGGSFGSALFPTIVVPAPNGVGILGGDIINDGLILVQATGHLEPDTQGVTLSGDGLVKLEGGSAQLGVLTGLQVTNAGNHRIEGAGLILGSFTNESGATVSANAGGGILSIFPTPTPNDKINNGQFRAEGGGSLRIEDAVTGSGSYTAEHGTIEVYANISEDPPGAGVAFTATGGSIFIGSATVPPISADGCGPVIVDPDEVEALAGGGIGPEALIEVTNQSSLIGANSWTIGDDKVGPGLTGTLNLLGGSTGMVNGDVLVNQNGTLRLAGASMLDVNGNVLVKQNGTLEINNSLLTLLMGGSLTLEPGATLIVVDDGASFAGGSDIEGISLSGNLVNQQTAAADWSWTGAVALEMTGGVGVADDNLAGYVRLEAAGEDMGNVPAGYSNNFELVELVIGAGAHVKLVDSHNNAGDAQPDALYVQTLTFADFPGASRLHVNGLNLYYNNIFPPGAEDQILGLAPLCPACVGDLSPASGNGTVNAADLAILLGAWGAPGCGGAATCCADLNDSGAVNAADLALLLGHWGPCQ